MLAMTTSARAMRPCVATPNRVQTAAALKRLLPGAAAWHAGARLAGPHRSGPGGEDADDEESKLLDLPVDQDDGLDHVPDDEQNVTVPS